MIEQVLVEYIANALWQVPLLAAGAWILLRVIAPEPRVQHWVWLTVLGLAVFLPMRGMGVAAAQSAVADTQAQMAEQTAPAFPAVQSDVPRLEGMPHLHSVHLAAAAVYWIVALYMSVTLLGLCRVVRAWRAARRLVEGSQETVLCARSMECLADYARRFGTTLPRTCESREVKSPMIVGVADPVLLLPVGFGEFSEVEVKAVLCHELAHVKRRDYLVNSVCQVVALPVAWHPATYGIQRRIRRTREMVCDAMAAREMESEIGYAKCLLALAREMAAGEGMAAQAAGLFGDNMLEERIMRLMETKTTLSMRAKVARIASGVTVMAAAIAVAAMFHVVPAMAAVDVAPQLAAVRSEPAASQAPADAIGSETVAPAPVKVDEGQATQKESPAAHQRTSGAEEPLGSNGSKERTAAEQRSAQKAMADAEKQMTKATADLNSPEFKKQMADAQRQIEKINTPEFRQKIAEAQQKALGARLNSPEFKKQMADAQRQIEKINSPEFKKEMADAQRQIEKINTPEFRQKIAEAQQKALHAQLNSPEFKKQMADAQRQMEKINSPEFKKQMAEIQDRVKAAMKSLQDQQEQGEGIQNNVK